MPLEIDERAISRLSDRALHRQLADLIRAAISTGQLQPNEILPSEGELAAGFELSKTAVREGLALLVQEGHVVKRAGMPSRVAVPAPVRHMADARYAAELAILRDLAPGDPHPQTSAFTDDYGIGWSAYSVQAEYAEDAATPADALRLELPTGAAVLRRQLVKMVHERPVQTQESVIPLDLVRGTPVADPNRQPWPGGTIAELWSVGLIVAAVLHEARARTPSTEERHALEMSVPGPVFEIIRVFSTAERPVEASKVVCPAPGLVLQWETNLD